MLAERKVAEGANRRRKLVLSPVLDSYVRFVSFAIHVPPPLPFTVLFNGMRSLLCTLVSLLLWMPHAPAQSAVLIGLHVNAQDDRSRQPLSSYRTFLITFREGKAQLAADLPDLIVPRKEGFWRVGTLSKGPPEEPQEFVYAVPARAVPHAVGEYHPPNPDWRCSETDQAIIEFVNPDLLSVSYLRQPACSLQVEYEHGTYKLDEPGKMLDISAVLGPSAWDAEKKADAASKSDSGIDLENCVGISEVDSSHWGIERSSRFPRSEAKTWVLVSDFNSPHVCGGGDTYEIKSPIPQSLTGPTYHADTLSSVLQSKVAKDNYIVPGEAILAPAADFLVSLGYSPPVRIFAIKQQGIEAKPVLSVPLTLESNVVMVQWALGKHVREWESELQSLQKTHLKEPTVAIGNRQGSD